MNEKEDFVFGMTTGGLIILLFYLFLFFPIVWIYSITPPDYRSLLKYALGTLFTMMLINSAKSAYESLKFTKNHNQILKEVEDNMKKKMLNKSFFNEGFKYRIKLELSFI